MGQEMTLHFWLCWVAERERSLSRGRKPSDEVKLEICKPSEDVWRLRSSEHHEGPHPGTDKDEVSGPGLARAEAGRSEAEVAAEVEGQGRS